MGGDDELTEVKGDIIIFVKSRENQIFNNFSILIWEYEVHHLLENCYHSTSWREWEGSQEGEVRWKE